MKEVKIEKELRDMQQTLEAIKVNLAATPRSRKAIPMVRSNIWCTRCGANGHFTSECPQTAIRRVQYVDQEGRVHGVEEEVEEEEEQPVYQVLSSAGRGKAMVSGKCIGGTEGFSVHERGVLHFECARPRLVPWGTAAMRACTVGNSRWPWKTCVKRT